MAWPAIPSQLLLVFSRSLQALSTPIVALLIATAGDLGERAETAISFCNVLFVGNLCASGVVLASFGPRRIGRSLRDLDARGWSEIGLFGLLSALLSGLIFTALETTTVTNSVLLSRLGPLLYALLSAWLLAARLRPAEWIGFGLVSLGVASTVFTGNGFDLVQGDVLILLSSLIYALVTLASKRLLATHTLAVVVFVRNLLSAVVFFFIASGLYGFDHFGDAFYGPLWGIMLVYALVVIVLAQFAYYRSLADLTPATIARWAFFSPLLAFGYALLINGERPAATHVAALAFVTLGIVVANLGRRTPKGLSDQAETSLSAG